MGGVAKAVSSVAQFAYDTTVAPVRAVIETGKSLGKGEGLGTALGKGIKESVKPVFGVAKDALGSATGIGQQQQQAMPEAPQGPSAAEQAAAAEAQRRKSLTDLAKDRPGRSQTVLTDQSAYPYRLV